MLRFFLVFAVAQASQDAREQPLQKDPSGEQLPGSSVFLAFAPEQGALEYQGLERVRGPVSGFVRAYGLHGARFDQGCFGAPGVYESRIVTSSWSLYEMIHEVRADEDERVALNAMQEFCPEGMGLSQCGWTMVLVRVIQGAWFRWRWERGQQDESNQRQLLLRKMTEAEQVSRHEAQDHVPYRKGCPVCIASQGRQRSHWRSSCPGVHSLSVDISGPFVLGTSWDVEASGRDKGGNYKYFLAGSYAIPSKFSPDSEPKDSGTKGGWENDEDGDYEPSEPGDFVPVPTSLTGELGSIDSSRLCRLLAEELCDASGEVEELRIIAAQLRRAEVAVTFAARYRDWRGVTIDVKSAFLYAPIRSDIKGTDERIIVKPPYLLVELGILKKEDRWWIRKALYGLPTSPRDWGRYRDGEFREFKIHWDGKVYQLCQLKSDDALWLARLVKDGELGEFSGILVVYVDDLAFFGPLGLCKAFIATVQAKWKTSDPEWLGATPVTFCGIELTQGPLGFRMSQAAYVRELVNRYQVTTSATVPIAKWVEPDVEDASTVEDVRAPKFSIALGQQVLGYLKGTQDYGIDVLELYTDASHSPGGDRSMQSVFIVWRGVPVAWESTRQPFTTLSSAEAELVCMTHGVQLAEAVQPLIDELLEDDSIIALLADNEAAIRSFESVSTGWRNRHLRMRAVSGRERVEAGLLRVSHLPGEYQVADL
ncbi:GIP, partial [Symbiodinium necroappetens]